jgi:biofilm PGA synthesis N-glycosyltransferase PgaC
VRTRSTLVGKIQVGEFSAIIGLMKRAQRIFGRVFTISGVVCAFRKAAIAEIGFWNSNMQTEDIEISWNPQLNHWDVRYEPRSVCWVLMPETLVGLVRQRYRWAVGGAETIKRYTKKIFQWKSRRMWVVYFEYAVSVLWAYNILVILITAIAGALWLGLPFDKGLISSSALILGGTCLLQFFISMLIDARYDHRLLRVFPAVIWYPLVYWLMNCVMTIVVFMTTIVYQKERSGRWENTDRGIHQRVVNERESERT